MDIIKDGPASAESLAEYVVASLSRAPKNVHSTRWRVQYAVVEAHQHRARQSFRQIDRPHVIKKMNGPTMRRLPAGKARPTSNLPIRRFL